MNVQIKNTYPNYKKIREEGYRISCSISESDFNTSRPNPFRIEKTISEINEYLRMKNIRRYKWV